MVLYMLILNEAHGAHVCACCSTSVVLWDKSHRVRRWRTSKNLFHRLCPSFPS